MGKLWSCEGSFRRSHENLPKVGLSACRKTCSWEARCGLSVGLGCEGTQERGKREDEEYIP